MSDQKSCRFTDTKLKKLINNTSTKRISLKDTTQQGLEVRISQTGNKTFRAVYWDNNKKKMVWKVIGNYPKATINSARTFVAKTLSDIARGVAPQVAERKTKSELTFDQALMKWHELHSQQNNKGHIEDLRKYHRYLEGYFGNKSMSEISEEDVLQWRAKLLKQKKSEEKVLSHKEL